MGVIITGLVILAVMTLPFIVASINNKNNVKQFLETLSNIAKEQNCTITKHEFCRNFIIGLDEGKNMLFFFKEKKNGMLEDFVNLAEIKHCKIVNTTKIKADHSTATDTLALSFSYIDSKKPDAILELFRADESIQIVGELQLAKAWEKLVNDRVS